MVQPCLRVLCLYSCEYTLADLKDWKRLLLLQETGFFSTAKMSDVKVINSVIPSIQANYIGDNVVQEQCLQLIDMNATEALASTTCQNITHNTLKKIISRSTLNIEEIDVWRACLVWAENECQRQGRQVIYSISSNKDVN